MDKCIRVKDNPSDRATVRLLNDFIRPTVLPVDTFDLVSDTQLRFVLFIFVDCFTWFSYGTIFLRCLSTRKINIFQWRGGRNLIYSLLSEIVFHAEFRRRTREPIGLNSVDRMEIFTTENICNDRERGRRGRTGSGETKKENVTILSDFEGQGEETRKRYRVSAYPSRGEMVIFIYEETTMKRDPPAGRQTPWQSVGISTS